MPDMIMFPKKNLQARLLVAILFATGGGAVFAQSAPASGPVTYQHEIRPLFKKRCGNCHNAEVHRGELDLSTYAATMEGSAGGPIATRGVLKDSLLYLTTHHLETPHMPPGKNKLPESELALIRSWIEGGLLEDRPAEGDPAAPKSPTADKPKPVEVAAAPVTTPASPPPAMEKQATPAASKEPATTRFGAVTALAAHPAEPLVAVAGQKQVTLLHAEKRTVERVLPFPEGEAFVLRFSASGRLLLAAGGEHVESGRVVLWDLASGNRLAEFGDESDVVLAADISPDEAFVALGGPSKIVQVYRVSDGTLLHRLDKHTDWLLSIAFSPDGLLFATADRAANLFVWETERGELVHTLRGHRGMIASVSWRPDGDFLVSGGEDGMVRLWSAHDGSEIASWKAHERGITDLRYFAEGMLATCGRDRQLKVWTAEGKQQVAAPVFTSIPLRIAPIARLGALSIGESTGAVSLYQQTNGRQLAVLNIPTSSPEILNATPVATKLTRESTPATDVATDLNRLLADTGRTQEELIRLIRNGDELATRAESIQSAVEKARLAVREAAEEARQARAALESAATSLKELRRADEIRSGSEPAKALESRLAEAQSARDAALALNRKREALHKSLQAALSSLNEESRDESLKETMLLVRLAAERETAAAENGRRDADKASALVEQLKKERDEAVAASRNSDDSPRHRETLAAARQKYQQALQTLERARTRLQTAEQSLGQLPIEGVSSPTSK